MTAHRRCICIQNAILGNGQVVSHKSLAAHSRVAAHRRVLVCNFIVIIYKGSCVYNNHMVYFFRFGEGAYGHVYRTSNTLLQIQAWENAWTFRTLLVKSEHSKGIQNIFNLKNSDVDQCYFCACIRVTSFWKKMAWNLWKWHTMWLYFF